MLGETDLRLWPRPRSELRARLRNPLSPPISLGEARIRRKRSLELRLRLAWGGQNSLILAGRRPGTAGYSGAVHRSLQEESAEKRARRRETARKEERRAKGEGERKGDTRKARPGEGRTKSWLGPGAARKWVRGERSKGGERPASQPPSAPRVPVPSLSLESNRCCLRRWEGKIRLGRRRGRAPAAERSPGLPHQTAVPDSGPSSS